MRTDAYPNLVTLWTTLWETVDLRETVDSTSGKTTKRNSETSSTLLQHTDREKTRYANAPLADGTSLVQSGLVFTLVLP